MIDWQEEINRGLQDHNDSDSHTELDPFTFHASQIGLCKRQAYLSKLGLVKSGPSSLGAFLTGTLIHEWLEENVQPNIPDAVFEIPVQFRDEPTSMGETRQIKWVGHTDCWDTENDVLYDFKTTGAHNCSQGEFYYIDDDGDDRHKDQLSIYMRALEVDKAKIVYICKKNPSHIRVWPEEDPYVFEWKRYENLLKKASDIAQVIEENGIPRRTSRIPFDSDDCWICEREELNPEAFGRQMVGEHP